MNHTRTAYVILGILAIHDSQSGYEIRKTVEQSVGFFWGESYGQIYPTLKRLAAARLVAAEGADTGNRTRRRYSITAAGREALEGWLALPFHNDPPRDEFLLKLFFGAQTVPAVSAGHVLSFQQKTRRLLDTLLRLESMARTLNSNEPGFRYWMLTLSFGVCQLRAALEWSGAALVALEAGDSASVPSSTDRPDDVG